MNQPLLTIGLSIEANLIDLLPLGILALMLLIMLRPRIRDFAGWRAIVTPLASIIGSGFLIVAPLLTAAVGTSAVIAMVSIVVLSVAIGGAIRYNILHDGRDLISTSVSGALRLEGLADVALAAAYVISISFYLRLMAAFVLAGADMFTETRADIMACAFVLFIGIYGWRHGLLGLERLEEYSVTVKLSIIVALLVWLAHHDWATGYNVSLFDAPARTLWEQLRLLAGMLLIVQGFETSKYLGSEYGRSLRARSMLRAQLIAGLIYVVFIGLSLPLMSDLSNEQVTETAIIDISGTVTPLLPPLLLIAAVMSQFSAAVADTIGAGGVVEQESDSRISIRASYPIIALASCLLIVLTNIYELVSIASRAFALYYFMQVLLALRLSWAFEHGARRRLLTTGYGFLSILMLLIVIFGKAVDG